MSAVDVQSDGVGVGGIIRSALNRGTRLIHPFTIGRSDASDEKAQR